MFDERPYLSQFDRQGDPARSKELSDTLDLVLRVPRVVVKIEVEHERLEANAGVQVLEVLEDAVRAAARRVVPQATNGAGQNGEE